MPSFRPIVVRSFLFQQEQNHGGSVMDQQRKRKSSRRKIKLPVTEVPSFMQSPSYMVARSSSVPLSREGARLKGG